MIVARRPRGLRGSFRPHLPWTEVETRNYRLEKRHSVYQIMKTPEAEPHNPRETRGRRRKGSGGHAAQNAGHDEGTPLLRAPRVESTRPCEAHAFAMPARPAAHMRSARNEGSA